MRGKDLFRRRCDVFERITPAYAGKSAIAFVNYNSAQDHPRLCGEKVPGRLNPSHQ